MNRPTNGTPTNAEIVRLLEALRSDLSELKRGQDDLVRRLEEEAQDT